MSTNHTPNYNLSQWEAGDKVLREDFNADNAKLDAALAAVDGRRLQLIREYETTEATNDFQIDLSDIDWKQWRTVHLDIIPAAGTNENIRFGYFGRGDGFGPISLTWNHVIYLPLGRDDTPIMGIYWGKTCEFMYLPVLRFNAISRAFLSASHANEMLAVGTKIIIRGERM